MDEQRTLVKSKENIIILGLFVLFGVLMFFVGRFTKETETEILTKIDTIVRVDTFEYWRTEFKDRYIYDTVEVVKEKEKVVYIKNEPKLYTDSTDRYQIKINAVKLYDYNLTLFDNDTVVYSKETRTIVESVKKEKWKPEFYWSVGIGVHYGLIYRKFDVGPYVGFGLKF